MRTILCLAMGGLLLGGCAGRQEMRTLAGDSATVLNDYRRELTGFAERQTAMNTDNQRRVQHFSETREMSEGFVRQRLLALEIAGDKGALEAYRLLTSSGAADLIAQSPLLTVPEGPALPPAVKFDASGVEKLTGQLNALRKPPTFWEQVRRVVAYRDELRDAYEATLSEAADVADDAAVAGEVATGLSNLPHANPNSGGDR